MDRSDFGTWGLGLPGGEFARALCAAGVRAAPGGDVDLRDALARDPVPWWDPRLRPSSRQAGKRLAAEWLAAVARRKEPLRLQLHLFSTDPTSVIRTLTMPSTGVDGTFVERYEEHGRTRWNWPLEVGLLGDPASERVGEELRGRSKTVGGEVRIVELGPERRTCDLLLLPFGPRAALAHLLSWHVSAACVVLLEPDPLPWRETSVLIDALGVHARSGGVVLADVRPGERAAWMDIVAASLAADTGLDVALHRAARRTPPIVLATPALIAETRLSRLAGGLAGEIESRVRYRFFDASAWELRDKEAIDVASELRFAAPNLSFRLGDLAHDVIAERPQVRFIQARVSEAAEDGEGAPVAHALRPDTDHMVKVRVGPPDEDWVSAAKPFPDDELDRSKSHRLTVAFVELAEDSEAQVQVIRLPPAGPSTECDFFVHTGESERPLLARIVVLHENRVLQTALLSADVGESAHEEPVRIDTESVLRVDTNDLDDRSRFDGALLLNEDANGEHGMTAISGADVHYRTVSGFEDGIELIRGILDRATTEPKGYDDLHGEDTLALLVDLANQGAPLRELLAQQQGFDKLVAAERIQVLALQSESYFPVELLYSGLAPTADAKLCSNAEQALLDGDCPDCRSLTEESVVCPLGFWGLRKVIERHAYVPGADHEGRWDYVLWGQRTRERPALATGTAAVFAASVNVDQEVANGRATVLAALQQVTDNHATPVKEWKTWKTSVENESPGMLVLLPHTVDHRFGTALSIEDGKPEEETVLPAGHVRKPYVIGAHGSPPIVFLLGCSTADAKIPYLGLPGRFKMAGAAIVVATLTRVLGRHAAPAAARLIELMAERAAERDSSFGETLTLMRRELMRTGTPLAMAIVAYGDADWALTREPTTTRPRRTARVPAEA